MAISLAAGDILTAARFNALVPMYVVHGTSDQPLTTSSADWAAGPITLGANETWVFRLYLDYSVSVAANNVQLQWQTPTGTATQSRIFSIGSGVSSTGAPTNAVDGGYQSRTQNASISYSGGTSTSTRGMAFQTFTATGGASGGTIKLQITMSAGTGVAYQGSFVEGHRVS